jgi:hypothetical protein
VSALANPVRFGTDYFSVEAQCIAPLRHDMTFIKLAEHIDAFDLPLQIKDRDAGAPGRRPPAFWQNRQADQARN